MWGLRQKMVTTAEVWKCISNAKWFWKGVSTCVLSPWYLHHRLDVTPITGHLKSPCKISLSNKATIILKPNIPHQHWCCLITCMSIDIESKWKLILTLWSCIWKPCKAHQNLKTGSPRREGLVHLTDLCDTVYIRWGLPRLRKVLKPFYQQWKIPHQQAESSTIRNILDLSQAPG